MPKNPEHPSAAQQETQFKFLRAIHADPTLSQRELANELGVSLGKTNYYIQGLIGRGWIEAKRFKNSENKIAYAYKLTPKGHKLRSKLTMEYLELNEQEHKNLELEVKMLKQEYTDKT